ncbi:MAG: aspartate--tRNA ligase [Candidatus Eremiobacteraeota bacterium]|nr:aspartate--tRNA ligase [Candidatus Eremiobacteraeota bacterium]
MFKRSCGCGEVNLSYQSQKIHLCGWVHKRRDLGGLIFIDLRDRSGIVQVVFNPEKHPDTFIMAEKIRSEYVVYLTGEVARRPPGSENPSMPTGEVEVIADHLSILNPSLTPPFSISEEHPVDENIRLKYRYIDLRRQKIFNAFRLRHKITMSIRNYLDSRGFLDIETPVMTRSTPEGARDYLVPSRVNPGKFYALAQSPQLFKQLLMIAGFEKYYQIARCYRDEDLRADRQPEFTQVDLEMSFVHREDVFDVIEGLIGKIFDECLGVKLSSPFPRFTYNSVINQYGTDKPDTRFGLELVDITDLVKDTDFRIIREVLDKGGIVKGINLPGCAGYSRKDMDYITEKARTHGARGLFFIGHVEEGIKSSLLKFFGEEKLKEILDVAGSEQGDLFMFLADSKEQANEILGRLRVELGRSLGLIKEGKYSLLWIIDFPLFIKDEETGELIAEHHPFTSPLPEDIPLLEKDPLKARAAAYDIVLNGYEIGSGSIRIHRREIQEKIFKLIGLTDEQARERFGFLLEAFEYGAPPHGGIALGLDRLCAIMAGKDSIREVVAFPKNLNAVCPLTSSPMYVDGEQLDVLNIKVTAPPSRNLQKTRIPAPGLES